MYLHFGLGLAENIESIEVLFQGGNTLLLEDFMVDQTIWIHEDGSTEIGDVFPSHFLPMLPENEDG